MQVIFRKRASNYRALLRKMTYKDKAYSSRLTFEKYNVVGGGEARFFFLNPQKSAFLLLYTLYIAAGCLLRIYRALLRKYRALLRKYRALSTKYRVFLRNTNVFCEIGSEIFLRNRRGRHRSSSRRRCEQRKSQAKEPYIFEVQKSPRFPQNSPISPQESPVSPQKSPEFRPKSPISLQNSPISLQQSPLSPQKSPGFPQNSPVPPQKSPRFPHKSPISPQESPLCPQKSPISPQTSVNKK